MTLAKCTPEQIEAFPFNRGNIDAKVAFVAEAPGDVEAVDPERRALIGPSGRELDRMLMKVGLHPDEFFYTNVVRELPTFKTKDGQEKKNFYRWQAENPQKYHTYVEMLSAELRGLENLNLIVPLGGEALQAVCHKTGIEKWRGSIIEATLPGVKGKKCVPTIHPAGVLRNWLYRPAVLCDLKRVKEEVDDPKIRLPERNYIIRPTYEQVLTIIHYLQHSSKNWISVDVETRNKMIVSVQLCDNPREAIAIPFQYADGRSYWPLEQEIQIWKALADLLENCGKRLIGQNFLTFDTFMFAIHGIDPWKVLANVVHDCMEAAQVIAPQLPKGLDFLTSIYTREPYFKGEGKVWATRMEENTFWEYGCKDVMVVSEIAPQQHQELKELNLLDFYNERYLEMAVERMEMSLNGVNVDDAKRDELAAQYLKFQMRDQCKLIVLANENINVNSHKQMKEFLYGTMKLPKQYRMDKGERKVTCNEDAILKLSAEHESEIFPLILRQRSNRLLYSNNIQAERDSDGRLRSSFGWAESGRFTSSACPIETGCLLPEAEVLTPQGWIRFDQLTKSQKVMVFDPKKKALFFEEPKQLHSFDHDGKMVRADSWFHKNVYTPDHRVILYQKYNMLHHHVKSARELPHLSSEAWYLPTAGSYVGNKEQEFSDVYSTNAYLDESFLRVLVMIQADGSVEETNVRISFKKPWKTERCLHLLDMAKIDYTLQKAREEYTRICINATTSKCIKDLIGQDKNFDTFLLRLNVEQLEAFIDELRYWDAHVRGKSFIYFTTNKKNAEWVATVAHLCNHSASIRETENNLRKGSFGYEKNTKTLYNVNIKPRNKALSQPEHYSWENYTGKVHCVSTSTGFFLTRYKNQISITGNTNLQNWKHDMRVMIIPDSPELCFVEGDLAQADARVVFWRARDEETIKVFLSGADFHKRNAVRIFDLPEEEIDYYRRYTAKRVVHACDYDMQAFRFAQVYNKDAADTNMTFITTEYAARLLDKYHEAVPSLRSVYHSEIREEIDETRTLWTPFGRRMVYHDRLSEQLYKQGYAWYAQATVADLINTIFKNFRKRCIEAGVWYKEVWIKLQVHDSVLVQCTKELRDWVCKTLLECANVPIEIEGRILIIPLDLKVGEPGKSWNELEEIESPKAA